MLKAEFVVYVYKNHFVLLEPNRQII